MTAWWTAAARARESQRDDRLFLDPWAAILASQEGIDEFDRTTAHQGTGTGDLQAISTRFFDDFLLRVAAAHAVRQVVLVAAGLDTRAFRLSWPPQTRLFELDQPQVLAYKERALTLLGAIPSCEWRIVGVDLTARWDEALCEAGFDPRQRSVWLLEGFLYFLPEQAVLHLLDRITALAASDSWLGLDVVNSDMLTSAETRYWIETLAAIGVPWLFVSDQPEKLLAKYGWTAAVTQPGEQEADFGRRPYPITPRSVPGAPRTFLVTATRGHRACVGWSQRNSW